MLRRHDGSLADPVDATIMTRRSREAGFTLLELMVVVVMIGILAAIAIPNFFSQSSKAKANSEVGTMFDELATREDQYAQENGEYLSTAACPATPTPNGTDATSCIVTGGAWKPLHARLPENDLRCSYVITAGTSTGTPSPPAPFTMVAPAGNWYYIVATCDMDGKSAVNSTYFVSSVDRNIQANNDGK